MPHLNEASSTSMSTLSTPDPRSVSRRTAHAVIWNYLSFGLGKLLLLISTGILARLLSKADFGLVGFATLTINYLSVIQDLGLGAALIYRREGVADAANTVFTMNLLVGVLLSAITAAIAPAVAAYFREPAVVPLLRWLGLTFILNALGAIHIVRLQRELAFNRKIIPDLTRAVVKGLAGIGLALFGFGAWSLVWGQIIGVIAGVIVAWIVFPWRPQLRIDSEIAGSMLGYGSSMLGINVLGALTNNIDYVIVGRMLGDEALGVYTLAYRLPELLVLNILWVVSAAIFPAYAAVQKDMVTLRRAFLATLRYLELVSVPLCLGIFLTADPFVRVAFGPKWVEAVPVVRILALFVLVSSVGSNVGDVYKAIGRPDILVKLGLVILPPLVAALWYGARFGLVGIALAHLAMGIVRTALRLWIATGKMEVGWRDMAREIMPAFYAGLALLACGLPAVWLTDSLPPLPRLLLITAAGAAAYLGVVWLLARDSLRQAYQLVRAR